MKKLAVIFKGFLIGTANIIPGVSGGTMALLLGIYERIINAINNISLGTLKSILLFFTFKKRHREEFKTQLQKIDVFFIGLIFIGALVSIVALARLTAFMLEHHHDPTYGFFFGLIIASIVVPFKEIRKKNLMVFILIVLGAALVIGSSLLLSADQMIEAEKAKFQLRQSSLQGAFSALASEMHLSPTKMLILVLSGAFSLAAMILPGISGSFVLLLMGQYFFLIKALSEGYFLILGIFFIGGMAGLMLFSRLIALLLHKWHNQTMAFLTGLVAGSLWVIWPFRHTAVIGDISVQGYPKTIYLGNTIPEKFALNEGMTLLTVLAGISLVILMLVIEKKLRKPQA